MPADGARRLVHLATTDENIDDRYFVDGRPAAGSPLLDDRDLATALWELAERMSAKYV
jgi:hypothetical protein